MRQFRRRHAAKDTDKETHSETRASEAATAAALALDPSCGRAGASGTIAAAAALTVELMRPEPSKPATSSYTDWRIFIFRATRLTPFGFAIAAWRQRRFWQAKSKREGSGQ